MGVRPGRGENDGQDPGQQPLHGTQRTFATFREGLVAALVGEGEPFMIGLRGAYEEGQQGRKLSEGTR